VLYVTQFALGQAIQFKALASYFITQNPGWLKSAFQGTGINHVGQLAGALKL
jgi:hypothetical protein